MRSDFRFCRRDLFLEGDHDFRASSRGTRTPPLPRSGGSDATRRRTGPGGVSPKRSFVRCESHRRHFTKRVEGRKEVSHLVTDWQAKRDLVVSGFPRPPPRAPAVCRCLVWGPRGLDPRDPPGPQQLPVPKVRSGPVDTTPSLGRSVTLGQWGSYCSTRSSRFSRNSSAHSRGDRDWWGTARRRQRRKSDMGSSPRFPVKSRTTDVRFAEGSWRSDALNSGSLGDLHRRRKVFDK